MDPDDTSAAHGPGEEPNGFSIQAPVTFASLLGRSDLVVAAVRAEPPWREVDLHVFDAGDDGQLRRLGPDLKTNASRWQVTAVVSIRPDGRVSPVVGSVIEVLTAQIEDIIFEHVLYHRPPGGVTISRSLLRGYPHGLPHDHAGEALLTLNRCRGWLAEQMPYHEAIDGGLLPVARRGEIEACWPELHPAPPPPPPRAARRWWWPW